MGMINENKPIGWVMVTLSSAVVSTLWFIVWKFSPWPVVGYVGCAVILSVPVILGIVAGVKRRKMKKQAS